MANSAVHDRSIKCTLVMCRLCSEEREREREAYEKLLQSTEFGHLAYDTYCLKTCDTFGSCYGSIQKIVCPTKMLSKFRYDSKIHAVFKTYDTSEGIRHHLSGQ